MNLWGKVVNLEYGLLESQKRLSQNLPSQNGNLEFNLKKTLGPPLTPPPGCGGCVKGVRVGLRGGVGGHVIGDAMVTQNWVSRLNLR